jgi:hypothetical protein
MRYPILGRSSRHDRAFLQALTIAYCSSSSLIEPKKRHVSTPALRFGSDRVVGLTCTRVRQEYSDHGGGLLIRGGFGDTVA